jgi:hypothetical protein
MFISNNITTQKTAAQTTKKSRTEQHTKGFPSLWQQLTLAQKFSVSTLVHFGYVLAEVHHLNKTPLAILSLGEKSAIINRDGFIYFNIEVSLPH